MRRQKGPGCSNYNKAYQIGLESVNNEVAESRVDYISDDLGINKAKVLNIIQKLRDIGDWLMQRLNSLSRKKVLQRG